MTEFSEYVWVRFKQVHGKEGCRRRDERGKVGGEKKGGKRKIEGG